MLSYLPGEVPPELGDFSADQVASAARLLRALHDSSLDFEPRNGYEVVCHGDASPCNCVFRNGRPYAFIDFDAAHLGGRREDVGYAAWLWLDIGNEDLDAVHQGRRLGEFVAAYGAMDVSDGIAAVMDAQMELSERASASVATREWAQHCLRWTTKNRPTLEVGLAPVRQAAF
jgi:aminoglycoside phosphotransferase (APT) family kinase protein